MANRVPGPIDVHKHVSLHKQPISSLRGAGSVPALPKPILAAPPRQARQHAEFHPPASAGINVRYVYTHDGDPVCEVWMNRFMVCPPPRMLKRKNPAKSDSFFRVGDTIFASSTSKDQLYALGFRDAEASVFTALLFFLLDIDSDDDYSIIWVFNRIEPNPTDQWYGRVCFTRFLMAGSAIVPLPNQDVNKRWDLQDQLLLLQSCDMLAAFQKLMSLYIGELVDIAWALTGGLEVKAAAEVAEKYVAKEVSRRAMKYMRPKFVAVVKGYIFAFAKELIKQIFHRFFLSLQVAAADKLLRTQPQGPTITIDQIVMMKSSQDLLKLTDQSSIDWSKCHAEGMTEALPAFWRLFADSKVATGALRRILQSCFQAIEKFFFDLGLKRLVEKAEGPIGNAIRTQINKHLAEISAEWLKELAKSSHGLTAEESKKKVDEISTKMLINGTLGALGIKYVVDNWEQLAEKVLGWAKENLNSAVAGALAEKAEK
jgi:hypothetical protein